MRVGQGKHFHDGAKLHLSRHFLPALETMKHHKDPRVDAYISEAEAFAQPFLKTIRKWVHTACPEVEETLKWGFPHFLFHGILCSMAGFKEHCRFLFWKGSILSDPEGILDPDRNEGVGHLGRLTEISQLPAEEIFLQYIHEAMRLNQAGVKVTTVEAESEANVRKIKPKAALIVPDDFSEALKKNKKAWTVFAGFSPTNKKDYVEWIEEAKTEKTRTSRLETSLIWISEGKPRNWKYM